MAKHKIEYMHDARKSDPTPQPVFVRLGYFHAQVLDLYCITEVTPKALVDMLKKEQAASKKALDQLISKIQRCQKRAHGFDSFDVEMCVGDSGEVTVTVFGYRNETEAEAKRRIKRQSEEEEGRDERRKRVCLVRMRHIADDFPDLFETVAQEILTNKG